MKLGPSLFSRSRDRKTGSGCMAANVALPAKASVRSDSNLNATRSEIVQNWEYFLLFYHLSKTRIDRYLTLWKTKPFSVNPFIFFLSYICVKCLFINISSVHLLINEISKKEPDIKTLNHFMKSFKTRSIHMFIKSPS